MKLNKEYLWSIVRFYQAAAVNTVFGISLYTALIYFGLDKYLSQIISHMGGAVFNYFTYSMHAFRAPGDKMRFFLSYLFSGVMNFVLLYLVSIVVLSAYIAGILAALLGSVAMFFILKYYVFFKARARHHV